MPLTPVIPVRFDEFLLFRKIEQDPLSEVWRARTAANAQSGEWIAVRRFTGGDLQSLRVALESVAPSLPLLTGTTVVRKQRVGCGDDGSPFLAWDYTGGRSLQTILERSLGGPARAPHPIPVELALSIVERVAFSLETTANLRHGGIRLRHGAPIPPLVWISEEGDVRLSGHLLAPAILASLADPRVDAALSRYLAPETKTTMQASAAGEVFTVGAVLHALLTGSPPPDPEDPEFQAIIGHPKGAGRQEVPSELTDLMRRALAPEPSERFSDAAELRTELSRLLHDGSYSATTFNLAFYLHGLLRDDFEMEKRQRGEEERWDGSAADLPVIAARPAASRHKTSAAELVQSPETPPARRPFRSAMFVGIAILIASAGVGALYVLRREPQPPPEVLSTEVSLAEPRSPALIRPEPLIAVTDTGPSPVDQPIDSEDAPDETGEEARRKAIEREIERRLQEEMMKLQQDHDRRLREERTSVVSAAAVSTAPAAVADAAPKPEPTTPEPAKTPQVVEAPPERASPKTPPSISPAGEAVAQTASASRTRAAPPVESSSPPPVQEGDLVEIGQVDVPPKLLRAGTPVYPPMAARQKAEATIIVSALVSEEGKVLEVRILRGDQRPLGLNEAAIEAVRSSLYAPATKSGKRVRTWLPVPVMFKTR